MLKIVPLLGLLTVSAFAEGGETDIIARTFNFIIFAGIIYYLIAEPLKSFFENRTLSIENQFKKNQEKLKESEEAKKEATVMVESEVSKIESAKATFNKELESKKAELKSALEANPPELKDVLSTKLKGIA